VYGAGAIPERWTGPLHVPLPGFGERVLRAGELSELARRLAAPAGSAGPAVSTVPAG
jgi:hypothetical protein